MSAGSEFHTVGAATRKLGYVRQVHATAHISARKQQEGMPGATKTSPN